MRFTFRGTEYSYSRRAVIFLAVYWSGFIGWVLYHILNGG